MPTLTSASTDTQVRAEFDDTASYHETGSVSLARRHVTACRIWLARHPQSSSAGGSAFTLNSDAVQRSLDDATQFLATANQTNGGFIHAGFREYRS